MGVELGVLSGIVTRERASVLARHVAAREAALPGTPLIVVDDGDEEDARTVRGALGGRAAMVVSRGQRRAVAAATPAARYALEPSQHADAVRVGAARNALLLLGRGRALFATDDDIGSDPRRLCAHERDGASGEDLVARTFADEAALERALEPSERDLAGWLGWMEADARGHGTLAYVAGTFGEPALGGAAFLLLGAPARQWGRAPELYDAALAGAPMARQAPGLVRHRKGQGMGGAFFLPEAPIVPPFLPTGSNEDGAFFATLQMMYPEKHIAGAPFALAHRGGRRRRFTTADLEAFGAGWRFADLVVALVRGIAPSLPAAGPGARLRSFGEALERLACTSEIDAVAGALWRARCAGLAAAARERAVASRACARAASDLHALVAAVERGALDFDPTRPRELVASSLAEQVAAVGRMFAAWPDAYRAREHRVVDARRGVRSTSFF